MSIGFNPLPPTPKPFEHLLWRVKKDSREAQAVVWVFAHGRELRVSVGTRRNLIGRVPTQMPSYSR